MIYAYTIQIKKTLLVTFNLSSNTLKQKFLLARMFPLAVMHKGREGVHQNVNVCEPKEGGLYQCKGSSINFGKAEIVVKSEKRSGTVLKGYH